MDSTKPIKNPNSRGVSFKKANNNKPWIARIGINYKNVSVGSFKTEQEALEACQSKRKELGVFKDVSIKKCSSCRRELPVEMFYKNKAVKTFDGRQNHCMMCRKEEKRTYYQKHKILIGKTNKHNHLKRNYGLDKDLYYELMGYQNGKCAICLDSVGDKKLVVDHNHDTKVIRGLLCNNCNHGIGNFKDKIRLLESAIKYIKSEGFNIEPKRKS